jgi:hypothetical protein
MSFGVRSFGFGVRSSEVAVLSSSQGSELGLVLVRVAFVV